MNTETATERSVVRAAVFARVSTEDQAAEGKGSMTAQLESTRRYADRQQWDVVEEFKEEGVSGSLEYRARPEVARLLALAEAGQLDVVVWDKADRQGRSVVEVTLIEQNLRDSGVEVHLVEGGKRDRQSADGVLIEGVRDLVAEAERLRIAQRVMRGRYEKAKTGRWVGGGAAPFGYRRDSEKFLVMDEADAEVVKFAYDRALAGDTLSEIARKLNGQYPRFIGNKGAVGFAEGTVRRWLTKPGYMGEGFTQHVAEAPGRERDDFLAPAPAIVTSDQWHDVKASLNASRSNWRTSHNRPVGGPRTAGRYALSKSIFHLHERGPVPLFAFTRDDKRAYRCTHVTKSYLDRWKNRSEFDPCPGWGVNPQNKKGRRTSVRASQIEAEVVLAMVEAFRSPETLIELQEKEDRRALAVEETEDTLEAARRETEVLVTERARIVRRAGRLTDAEFDALLDDVEARQRVNGERIARLEGEVEQLASFSVTIEEIVEATASILGIGPGDETEYDISEEGEPFIIAPGWENIVDGLRADAEAVLGRRQDDLARPTVEWLNYMVARFGVRVFIEGGNGSEFAYRFKADRGRLFGEAGVSSTVNSVRRP